MSVFWPLSTQRGKEEYKLAATSDGKDKKGKKKGEKDMDDLKKEVDLVSERNDRTQRRRKHWAGVTASQKFSERNTSCLKRVGEQ